MYYQSQVGKKQSIDQTLIVCLKYLSLPSPRRFDNLSFGFVCEIFNRATALGANKVNRSIFHVRILFGSFGFADHHLKATYGLGFEFTMYGKVDSVKLGRNAATADIETI